MLTIIEVEDKIRELSSHPGVLGVAVFRCSDGGLISTSLNEVKLSHFIEMGQSLLRQGEVMSAHLEDDPLTYVRMRFQKHELIVTKENEYGFLLVR
eukprot:CFRG2197T1